MQIDENKLKKLFELAGIKKPENCDESDINQVLVQIESKLSTSNKFKSDFKAHNSLNILIVDDLEISLHQFNLLLTKSGHDVTVARSLEQAKDEIRKQNFDYIVLDLFLPDSKDGFDLIDFIKLEATGSKYIVISGSDDKELIQECIKKGAITFVEKAPNWHNILLETIKSQESYFDNTNPVQSYNIKYQEDNTCVIRINFINTVDDIEHIKTEVSSQIYQGLKKLVFDFKGIREFSKEYSYLFVDVYKMCAKSNVTFAISSVEECIIKALKHIFLDETIKVYRSSLDAIKLV